MTLIYPIFVAVKLCPVLATPTTIGLSSKCDLLKYFLLL